MELKGRKSLVMGAGRSGKATARFLAEKGAIVALHDQKPIEQWDEDVLNLRESHGVGLLSGELPSWLLDQIDLLVISPGVPTKNIPARYVDRKDGEVIGEIELASRFLRGRLVAITGSNGKTTTTTLTGKMLSDAGFKVLVGGNIGKPLLELVELSDDETWTVAEVSSFQLETIKYFHPDVAACLNVTANHLDRYDSFLDYAAAKHRIFMNQTPSDTAILNADNEITASWVSGLAARKVLFSVRRELEEGLFLRGSDLVMRTKEEERILINRDEIFLRGLHNVENILAAFAVCIACSAPLEKIRNTVSEFRGVEHRIEYVSEIHGVKFFNDSKATSVDATAKALEAFSEDSGSIVLIMGGRGKNAPYAPLIPLIKNKVRAIVAIGEDAQRIHRELSNAAQIIPADSMENAVNEAFSRACKGDTVLLAPACASFDMFQSFEHRGDMFKKAVYCLEREENETLIRKDAGI